MISPRRFKEGGAPMLEAERINHQKVIIGNNLIKPLVMSILRVCVDSYVILAIANKPEEHRPWAIISKRAPVQPQDVLAIIPPVTSPICLTLE